MDGSTIPSPHMQPRVFLALGSNLGNPVACIHAALDALAEFSLLPPVASSLWSSTPVDCPPGSPRFVNAAACIQPRPGLTPHALLAHTQSLERRFGRKPGSIPNAPRPLDIDLIAWDTLTLRSPDLQIPHPRAHLRRFVLQPLAEIAPDLLLPGQSLTVAGLLESLASPEVLHRLHPTADPAPPS